MSKRNNNKEGIKELEKDIASILVINNRNLKPYIEMFEYSGENIIQEQLGTLLGFFEIADYSEYSMYVVNFLASVLKKEYFANSRRPAIESFEAALNKVNIALSELAKQGNVGWLGKINATVCVLEKNSIHLTVAGDAQVILIRNQLFSNISEDLAVNEPEPHPLKTFVNVSSGRIEKNDKFIITTNSIFEIFSPIEISKSSIRFPKENFIQFIKTAMVNELNIAATFIVDVSEPKDEYAEDKSKKEPQVPFNAFSGKAFKKSEGKPNNIPPKKERTKDEYVDSKTGHIYVHGENQEQKRENKSWQMAKFIIKEKCLGAYSWFKLTLVRKIFHFAKKFRLFSSSLLESSIRKFKELIEKARQAPSIRKNAIPAKDNSPVQEVSTENNAEAKKIYIPAINFGSFLEKIKGLTNQILPYIDKLRIKFGGLGKQQKLFALITVIMLIVGFLVWKKIGTKKTEEPKIATPVVVTDPLTIYAGEKNIIFGKSVETIITADSDLRSLVFADNQVVAVSQEKVIQRSISNEVKESAILAGSGKAVSSAYMKDLSLILILTDQNKIISFSINNGKFQENKIVIPEGAKISGMATYLTYLYLADAKNNKIYRYPRAEGGFGEGINWLKEGLGLENVSDMAIDENVYLAGGERINKLFKGKSENAEFEQSKTPVSFNQVFTEPGTANIYVLDGQIGRIIKYEKGGKIISQYYAEKLKGANDLVVDEKGQQAYIINSANVFSIALQ